MSTKQAINLNEIEIGDVFSEESHYVFTGKSGNIFQFKHLESGNTINLDEKYVTDLLTTADQYEKEVEVGKEDKYWTDKQIEIAMVKGELPIDTKVRAGDVRVQGIRSIWAGIYSSQVFTVSFNKQSKTVSAKALKEARDKQLADVLAKLNGPQPQPAVTRGRGRPSKNIPGIMSAKDLYNWNPITIEQALRDIQENPILTETPGEERILRGYKSQFTSVNGVYDVIDMDIVVGMNQRAVNVNEINWLVIDTVKYIVK